MDNYIAFDIGGTMIKFGILDENAKLLLVDRFPTRASAGGTEIIRRICQKMIELKSDWNLSGAGISTAGMVDHTTGTITYANDNIPGYTGINVKQLIEKKCGIVCEVENDVACAALSEQRSGAARGSSLCLGITVGTGIGGAVIMDGKIFHGFSNCAGNIGYTHVFGKTFESIASARALIEQVQKQKGIKDNCLNGEMIFELARQKDRICEEAIQNMCDKLAYGIANACCMINPEVVVLGGGIMEQKEYLNHMLQDGLDKYLTPEIRKNTKLVFAENGNNAGLLGAYFNFKEKNI